VKLIAMKFGVLALVPVGLVVLILGDLWGDDRSQHWWAIWRRLWRDCASYASPDPVWTAKGDAS
jgi:hypothetical protein